MIIFHNFEHSSLPILFMKQNKDNWERNYMKHFYNFMQFWYSPLSNLPQIFLQKALNWQKYLKNYRFL